MLEMKKTHVRIECAPIDIGDCAIVLVENMLDGGLAAFVQVPYQKLL